MKKYNLKNIQLLGTYGSLEMMNWGRYLLRALLNRGTNVLLEKARSTIIEGHNYCIDTWCSKHGVDKSVHMEWKGKGKSSDEFNEKIKTSNKTSSKFHKIALQQSNPLNTLNDIHNQFVVTPIDKASGNVACIYQWFYAHVLIKELVLDHNNIGTNNTYIPVHKANNQFNSGHTTSLRNEFNSVFDEEKKFPNNYWIPKLQRNSINFLLKPLSKAVP